MSTTSPTGYVVLRIEPSPFGLVSPPALRSAGLPAPFRAWPRGSTSGFTRPAPKPISSARSADGRHYILCPIVPPATQHLVLCPCLAYGGVKGAHKAAARTARRFTRASRNGRRERAQRPLMQPEADPNPLRQRTGSASPPALCRPARERECFLPNGGAVRPLLACSPLRGLLRPVLPSHGCHGPTQPPGRWPYPRQHARGFATG